MTGLVTLRDAKAHLQIPTSDTTNDTEIQGFIDAATPIIENIVGPVNARTVTNEIHYVAGCSRILLRVVPVLSVTTITEYIGTVAYPLTLQPITGSTHDNYGYSLDVPNAGLIVRRGAVGNPMNFLGSQVAVTYQAGRASVDPDIRLAALEDIRGLWQQTQQGGRATWRDNQYDENWGGMQSLHLFPRLAAILDGKRRVTSIA